MNEQFIHKYASDKKNCKLIMELETVVKSEFNSIDFYSLISPVLVCKSHYQTQGTKNQKLYSVGIVIPNTHII